MPAVPVPGDLPQQVAAALAEDIGGGDLTAALIPEDRRGTATVITREAAILCGTPYVEASFRQIDPTVSFDWQVTEGERIEAGQVLFSVSGAARTLLTGERTALNFLQLLSATATAAHTYAKLLEGTQCRLLDTRKTIPGLRTAQKYAVRVGGGHNHRMGLFDGVLIKENHIVAAGSITLAVAAARQHAAAVPVASAVEAHGEGDEGRGQDESRALPKAEALPKAGALPKAEALPKAGALPKGGAKVEVEVENLLQLREAIDARADIVMLDNFSLQQMRDAVALNSRSPHPVKLEASGGISEATLRDIAATGVDFVSVGSITKHVRAIDLSMRFEWDETHP